VAQISVVQPSVIILFGKMAIDHFLGAGSMTERIGQKFERDGVLFIPLPHSSGASTWLNSSENRERLAEALAHIKAARLLYTASPR